MFRNHPEILSQVIRTETTPIQTTNVSVGNEGFTIIPKSAVNGIMAWEIYITANVSGSGTISGKVGDLLKELKIRHGANTQLDVNSFDELAKVYHMLTGKTLSNVDISGAGVYTLRIPIMPFMLDLGAPNYFDFKFNAPSTVGADTLSMSANMVFYYGGAITDNIVILNPASTLNANTDINLLDYVSENKVIKEMWVDIGADDNLNYAKFYRGHSLIYDTLKPEDLVNIEIPLNMYSHIDGFFKMPIPYGTISKASGSTNVDVPKLIANFKNAVSPVIYLHLQ